MTESQFINVQGIRTHYLESENGNETVILLHGGGVDGAELSWKLTIPALAEHYHVIAPDWPGYGKSGDSPTGMTMQNLVKFCLEFMDQLEIRRAHLVGLSMGGGAAIGVALAKPECALSLTLVDSYGLADKVPMHLLSYWIVKIPWISQVTYAWMKKSKWLTRWSLSSILKRSESISPDLVEEVYQAVQDDRGWKSFEVFQQDEISPNGLKTVYTNRLAELEMPTLIIHGEKDTLVPLAAVKLAEKQLKNSHLVVIPGCGHWPGRDAPDEFTRALLEFLDSISEEKVHED